MDNIVRILYQERSSHQDTLGILFVQKKDRLSPITDGFDGVLLVVVNKANAEWSIDHFIGEEEKLQVITITKDTLANWLEKGINRRAIEWVLHGKVLFDRNEYLTEVKRNLDEFPLSLRRKKLCIEFARLIRSYQEAKELFDSHNILDAYNEMLKGLHHLARLTVIERGLHPEVTLWKQVKKIDPEIYKLYDELITGEDSVEKKLQLLFLASEFSLMAKTKTGAAHLINILQTKQSPWLMEDLLQIKDVKDYELNVGILLEHLIKKNIVKEVAVKDNHGLMKRAYIIVEQ